MSEQLWAIVGATGSGKTSAAIELCERVGGEIVSVDSAQVFIGLDIGTAKPTAEEQARARHHLIDVIGPEVQWTAPAFATAADRAIEDIRARGRVPILVGGAGLWYRALTRGVFDAPDIAPAIRDEVRRAIVEDGAAEVHRQLAVVDTVAAEKLHPNDTQRVGRALEFFRQTGEPISAAQARHRFAERRYRVAAVAFDWPKDALGDRLQQRAQAMIDGGLVEEVRALLDAGLDADSPGLKCIGYKEIRAHLAGALSLDDAIEAILVATRRYAKRQRNWFRSETEVRWLPPTAPIGQLQAELTTTRD